MSNLKNNGVFLLKYLYKFTGIIHTSSIYYSEIYTLDYKNIMPFVCTLQKVPLFCRQRSEGNATFDRNSGKDSCCRNDHSIVYVCIVEHAAVLTCLVSQNMLLTAHRCVHPSR